MTDFYLRFDSADDWEAVAPALASPPPGVSPIDWWCSVAVIGAIGRPTGEIIPGPDGADVPEMAALPGWHVNIRAPMTHPAFAPYIVHPAAPAVAFM
jgi:hypothetical protein